MHTTTTTQLSTPNSHALGTPESMRCSRSNPLRGVLYKLCFGHGCLSAAVGLLGGTLIEKYIATATSRPSDFLHSHPLVIPYLYMLASTADKHRGRPMH